MIQYFIIWSRIVDSLDHGIVVVTAISCEFLQDGLMDGTTRNIMIKTFKLICNIYENNV